MMKRRESTRNPLRPWAAATALTALLAAGLALPAVAGAESHREALRVCADPNNLPFSNRAEQGFENRIAHVLAEDLGLPVEYAWYPMQMGFARKTLGEYVPEQQSYRCDLIIGTTSGLEVGKTTEPYYHSTYTLIYRRGAGLDGIRSLDDIPALPPERLQSLRIGVFARSPTTQWLIRHGLSEQMVSYQSQSGSSEITPGTIIRRDLASGKLDMIFVWGPIGGYHAERIRDCTECRYKDLEVVELGSAPGQRYHFGISMGVRYGEDEWLGQIEDLIRRNREEITAILREYNVPLVDPDGRLVQASRE